MLATMTDAEALETLRNAIRMLFPAGPAQGRWLAWADRIQDEGITRHWLDASPDGATMRTYRSISPT
jgi:hypothetical protein